MPLDRTQFNGYLPDSAYTGVIKKGWAQRTDGTWEQGRRDFSQAPVVVSEQQARSLSGNDRGPYAVGQGGFIGSLRKLGNEVAPLVDLVPGVGPIYNASLRTADALANDTGGGSSNGAGISQTGSNGMGQQYQTNADAADAAAMQQLSNLQNYGNVNMSQFTQALPYLNAAQMYAFQRAGLLGPNGQPLTPGSPATAMPSPNAAGGTSVPVTAVPMMSNPQVNGGAPFAGWGSRRTAPGNTVVQQAGTPVGSNNGQNYQDAITKAALGIYNSPEYQGLRSAAQEDINRNALGNSLNYNNALLGRGMENSSLAAGGNAAIYGGANQEYNNFNRNLAINAADKEDQLVNAAQNSLTPSLQMGPQAASAYNNVANAGNTLTNTNADLATASAAPQGYNGSSNNDNSKLVNQILNGIHGINGNNSGGSPGTFGPYGASKDSSSVNPNNTGTGVYGPSLPDGVPPINFGNNTNDSQSVFGPSIPDSGGSAVDNTSANAHGGYLQLGHPTLVGEGSGAETFVPLKGQAGKEPTVNIPHSLFAKWMEHTMAETANMPHRAVGGSTNPAGGPVVVGEHGPEIFYPQTNGMIIPHSMKDFRAGAGQPNSLYSDVNTSHLPSRGSMPQYNLDPIYLRFKQMHSRGGR